MDCRECSKLLSQFLDNQLDEKQLAQVKKHLQSCQRCAAKLESLSQMITLMKNMKPVKPPEDFLEKVNQRIDQATIWQRVIQRLCQFWQRPIPVSVLVVSASVVLVVYITNQIKTDRETLVISSAPKKTDLAKKYYRDENIPASSSIEPKAAKLKLAARAREDSIIPLVKEELIDKAEDSMVYNQELAYLAKDADEVQLNEQPKTDKFKSLNEQTPSDDLFVGGLVQPEAEMADKTTQAEEPELKTKQVVLSGSEEIFLNDIQQDWILKSVDWRKTKNRLEELLKEFETVEIKKERYSEAKKRGIIFKFKIRYGYLSTFYSRLKVLGELEALTAFPVPRPGVYVGPRGGCINPRILEELIPINLTVCQ